MIDVRDNPPFYLFAGNPVLFEACSDNFLVSQGSYASFEFIVYDIDTNAGRTFKLKFAGKTLIFQTASQNLLDGLSFQVADPGQSFNSFASNLYQTLCENYEIQRYFYVTLGPVGVSQRKITLVARHRGSDSSVTISDIGVWGILSGNNIAGTNTVYRDYFSILCLLRDDQDNVIGEDRKPVDLSGSVRFDLSDYLLSKFSSWGQPRFEFPELEGNGLYRSWDYILKFRASFAECIGGTVKGLMPSRWYFALPGGLNRELLTALNAKGEDYFSVEENKKKFLSWHPVVKNSRSGIIEKLFFLFQDNSMNTKFRLMILVTFTDGFHKLIEGCPLTDIIPNTVLECKVGFDHLNLVNLWYGKTVSSWQVFLLNQDDEYLSETRVLYNDLRVFENEKAFFFRNSFSAYDTFRFLGKSDMTMDYDRISSLLVREERYSFYNATSKLFSAKESESCKANSGWISREVKNYLRELLLSTEAYETIGKELFPIVIKTAKVASFLKDGEYLYNLEIEYERAYQNSFFSFHTPESSANTLIIPDSITWDEIDLSFDDMEVTFDQEYRQ
jgi:hypothetical protein